MRFQTDSFSCGVFALKNALSCLGKNVSEKILRKHTAVSPEHGTQDHGIKNALERLGMGWSELSYGKEGDAWKALTDSLVGGSPVILATKKDQHWVTAIGTIGSTIFLDNIPTRVIIYDPSDDVSIRKESGTFVLTKRQLFEKWTQSTDGKFYGICVSKGK